MIKKTDLPSSLLEIIEEIKKSGDSYLLISMPKDAGSALKNTVIKASDIIDIVNEINNTSALVDSRCTDFQAMMMGAVAAVTVFDQLDDPNLKELCACLLHAVIDKYADDEEDL